MAIVNNPADNIDKSEIIREIVGVLERDLERMVEAASTARKAATEAESKAENKYDTRSTEASYLADGQARRAADLIESIAIIKALELRKFDDRSPIQISALVELETEAGERQFYFMLPQRGGIKIKYQSTEIFTISPDSPLGASLLLKTVGEDFELKIKNQSLEYRIISVR